MLTVVRVSLPKAGYVSEMWIGGDRWVGRCVLVVSYTMYLVRICKEVGDPRRCRSYS